MIISGLLLLVLCMYVYLLCILCVCIYTTCMHAWCSQHIVSSSIQLCMYIRNVCLYIMSLYKNANYKATKRRKGEKYSSWWKSRAMKGSLCLSLVRMIALHAAPADRISIPTFFLLSRFTQLHSPPKKNPVSDP